MKKILLSIIALILSFNALAQETPFYKQYLFDPTLLNPAVGAKYEFISIKLTGADQWISMPKHPQFQSITYNQRFGSKMGINAAILNDAYGSISKTGLKFSYFYYTKLNVKGDYISYGINASIMQSRFDMPNDGANPDIVLQQGGYNYFSPNIGIGIFYNKQEFALGFSAGNLLPDRNKALIDTIEPYNTRIYFFTAETKFSNEIKTFMVVPSIMFYMDERVNRELDLNSKFIFQNKFWFGISYRDALNNEIYAVHNAMAMVGFKFFKKLNISYGFEIGVLQSRAILGGTHYFMLGYDFVNVNKKVPIYF